MPSRRKVMSRVKKREKKATVERRVAMRRRVVKMNHPCWGEGVRRRCLKEADWGEGG